MNANELADLLISTKFQVDEDGTMIGVSHQAVDEAATVLRQQQAEIEALKSRELTDEEWNKAFDYYCETDEGVLKFDLELRDEWKKEQLIRWKEALRKAQEK